LPDAASLPVYTVPSKADQNNMLENNFKVRAVYEVIPNQDFYFLYGKTLLYI
jgi:hypothetical protein